MIDDKELEAIMVDRSRLMASFKRHSDKLIAEYNEDSLQEFDLAYTGFVSLMRSNSNKLQSWIDNKIKG